MRMKIGKYYMLAMPVYYNIDRHCYTFSRILLSIGGKNAPTYTRSSQKATAAAAATLSESTLCDIGMRTT